MQCARSRGDKESEPERATDFRIAYVLMYICAYIDALPLFLEHALFFPRVRVCVYVDKRACRTAIKTFTDGGARVVVSPGRVQVHGRNRPRDLCLA